MSIRPSSLLCALVALCVSTAATAQPTPYVFSERVGPEIDAAERAYFGLFPGADAGASAQAYAVGDSVEVVIADAESPGMRVTMTRGTAEALGRFIETFEQAETAFYNPDWQVASPFVRADVPVPYTGSARAATFFVDGGRYVGHPTYASSDVLLIGQSGAPFDWRTFDGLGVVLRTSEVTRVQLAPSWLGRPYVVLAGIPLGVGVNELLMSLDSKGPDNAVERRIFAAALGAATVKVFSILYARTRPYKQAIPAVQEVAWFNPEVRPLEMPSEAVLLRRTGEDRPAPVPIWRGNFGWLSVGTGGISFNENRQTYDFISGFEPEADPEREVRYESVGALLEAAAAVRPLAWLSVGVGVYIASNQGPEPLGSRAVPFAELEEVAYSQPLLRVFADVDVLRLALGQSRFGLEVGGGLLRSESAVAFDVSNVIGRADRRFTYEPAGYDLTEAGFTPFYQATLSVGLARETSAYANIIVHGAPDVDVPLFEAGLDFDPEVTVFRVEPHTVSFDYVGVSAGVRLGF